MNPFGKVGMFINTQFPEGDNVAARVPELVEQVRLARQVGFSSVLFPHHYLTDPLQMLQITPLMAYLLPETKGMTIGGNIQLLPLLNPVHVAEESATFDVLSEGNFILGVGLGKTVTEFPIARECYVGASHATAMAECRAALEYKYNSYAVWGMESPTANMSFEEMARDRFNIGDKVSVKEEIARWRESLGVNHFVMRVQWPGLKQEKVLGSIRRRGEIFAQHRIFWPSSRTLPAVGRSDVTTLRACP